MCEWPISASNEIPAPSVSTPTGRSAECSVDGTLNRTGPVDYGDYAALELMRFLTRGEHRADQGHHIEALERALAVAPRGTGRTHERCSNASKWVVRAVPPPTPAPAGRTVGKIDFRPTGNCIMKDFPNACFPPETLGIMKNAMDAAVAELPDPVSSAHIHSIAETILRTAKEGETDTQQSCSGWPCWSFRLRREASCWA
jgi:hypothetical protein